MGRPQSAGLREHGLHEVRDAGSVDHLQHRLSRRQSVRWRLWAHAPAARRQPDLEEPDRDRPGNDARLLQQQRDLHECQSVGDLQRKLGKRRLVRGCRGGRMSKHQATRQRLRRRKEMRRRARADRSRRRRLQHEPVGARARLRRREFLVGAAGTGLLLAAPSLLGSCRHDDDVAPGTLFFNFSQEDFASRTYFLTGGGKNYRLTKVTDAPDVLVRARRHNAFLRGVPDGQITHHIEGTSFATDSVTLSYVSSDIDTGAGTWSMSAVYVLLPPGSISHAYERARARTPSGPLPLSPKRAMYGIPAARTEDDLLEEQVFLDANSQ